MSQFDASPDCAVFVVIIRIGRSSAAIQLSLESALFLLDILYLICQFYEVCLICCSICQRLRSDIKPDRSPSDRMHKLSGA